MTEARREVCCPGNGLPPFAVGAEVLLGELETIASEIRWIQRGHVSETYGSRVL